MRAQYTNKIYKIKKRAELWTVTSELKRSWEVVSAVVVAPTLLSVPIDEQFKCSWEAVSAIVVAPTLLSYLSDRFQRPCGFDMWYQYTNKIYDMQKRAKLRATGPELECLWEAVSVVAVARTLTLCNNLIINILHTIYLSSL